MNRIVVKSRVGSDGVLKLTLPLGAGEAGREVQVTVEESVPPCAPHEWRDRIMETAGKWEGEFERPDQGEYEIREPLS